MAVSIPYPDLNALVKLMGEAGEHLAGIGASEGAAGNISVVVRWPVHEVLDLFPHHEPFTLPLADGDEAAPELANATIVVTGSGRRLREIARDPQGNLAVLKVGGDGKMATLYTARRKLFTKPTTELVSHLGIHRWAIGRSDTNFHAVVHAQPLHIVYLSHLARYQNSDALNQRIMRWQPETIVQVPDGVGYTPYTMPGSPELMNVTLESMARHQAVLWAKHGMIVRSETSVKKAVDLIEYIEVGARYEYINMMNGDAAEGLTADEIRELCAYHGVEQSVY